MASCLVPDFPAVNVALEHLGDLDKQLRAERVSFSQEASHHLSEIAEAIKELEASRKATHEELEVETIETGKLRYQLLSQHDSTAAEISAAVAAARDANAAEIDELQLEMANVLQEIESMEKRRELLEEQNVLLLPEHQRLNICYTELLEQLNRQLSEKADTQISLNETRKETQSTREEISRVHSTRKYLQDNLIGERKHFEETKKMLEKEIDEMMNSIQEQAKTNTELQEELDVVVAEFVKKEKRADGLSNRISSLERSLVRLKTSQHKHEDQIRDKTEKSDQLTHLKELREKEFRELRDALNLRLLSLQENIATVERQIEEEQKENGVRLEAVSELSSIFRVQREKEDDAQVERSGLSTELDKSKQRLDKIYVSIAKNKREIKEMEEEMKQLHEANRLTVELFRKNMVELEGELVKEKNSRETLEVERDELGVRIETLKEQHEDSMRKLCSAVSLHKTRHSELAEEKKKLQEHESMSSLAEELTHHISRAEEERKQMETMCKNEIQQLNTEAESINRARLDEEKELKDRELELSKVEAQFDVDLSQHQVLIKRTTELQAMKDHLQLSIQEVKEQTAAMLQPREALKEELQTLRENHMELLRSYSEQISTTEKSIYKNGQMLENVNVENSRLHVCIEQMKKEISNARRETEKYTQEIGWMKEEVQSIYRTLVDAWVIDKLVTEVRFPPQHVIKCFISLLRQHLPIATINFHSLLIPIHHTLGICRNRPGILGSHADVRSAGRGEEAAHRRHQQQTGGGAKGHERAA
ncbi:myosin-J heavy chain isoform X2 [Silurus meridionalis]|uniref:myosin-J heavy chain isoform X2 n=1 Tax=Silurus meridionalis TaxID=175797 RepID=UPI001EEC87EB|nr:myosin-J heavy chain isoform X2 [Silurus meridionalis]